MEEEDIYQNKRRYNEFLKDLDELVKIPSERNVSPKRRIGTYYCKNKENLKYFKQLARELEVLNNSAVRNFNVMKRLLVIVYISDKDLKDWDKKEFQDLMIYVNKTYNENIKKKVDNDKNFIFKLIFGENSEQHKLSKQFKIRLDKSRQKVREDKLSWEEYEKIITFFDSKPNIQCFLTVALESLGRPQELLYLRIKDINIFDNYGRLTVSSHGKEGVKEMQIIDSLPYILKWLEIHPNKKDKNSFLFVSTSDKTLGRQMTPVAVNKQIRLACKILSIKKPVTCYSLKRNGITFRRLRGDSDLTIMHLAGWTSTKQLQTYDLSTNKDTFKLELIKRGLIRAEKGYEELTPKNKNCLFCNINHGFNEEFCSNCKRPLDRNKIKEQEETRIKKDEELIEFINGIKDFKDSNPEVYNEIREMGRKKFMNS